MACLYCGKEIGPFRLIRDSEFCSSGHRKKYGARLGKALHQLSTVEPTPVRIAEFVVNMPTQSGNCKRFFSVSEFRHSAVAVRLQRSWPVSVAPVAGSTGMKLACKGAHPPEARSHVPQRWDEFAPSILLRMPEPYFGPVVESEEPTQQVPPIADAAPAFATAPVEEFLPPMAEVEPSPFEAFALRTQHHVPDAALRETAEARIIPLMARSFMAAAPACEVEAFLPSPQVSQMAFASAPVELRALSLEAVADPFDTVVEPQENFLPSPAACEVEAFLPAPQVTQMAFASVPVQLRALSLEAAADPFDTVVEVQETFLPSLAACEVESFLPAPQIQEAAFGAQALTLPAFGLTASELEAPEQEPEPVGISEAWMASPAACAVENFLPAPQVAAMDFAAATLALPSLTLITAEAEVFENELQQVASSPLSEVWMQSPAASEVMCDVWPSMAGYVPVEPTVQAPALAPLSLAAPMIRVRAEVARPSAAAEPVVSHVAPLYDDTVEAASASMRLPDVASLGAVQTELPRETETRQRPPLEAAPAPIELVPAAMRPETLPVFQVAAQRVIPFPALMPTRVAQEPAGVMPMGARIAQPAAAQPDRRAASLEPMAPAPAASMRETGRHFAGLPKPGMVPIDYLIQRMTMSPIVTLSAVSRSIPAMPPRFNVRPVLDRPEEVVPPRDKRRTPAFAEIFTMTKSAGRRAPRALEVAAKVLAASVLVATGLWFGTGSVRLGRQMLAVNTDYLHTDTPAGYAAREYTGVAAPGGVAAAPVKKPDGALSKVRRAIQQRAAVELSDTFRGMEAWGSKGLPSGWSRKEGYVRAGQLAVYHPSVNFTDYHLEFFGQIESKSMGWAVRAHDAQNYLAMKFTVVEPGLRPVVAMVHYPVVDGKRGAKVETPLTMMVHNNEPYHVAVDVAGNHVTTYLEGQQVDSWTDDSIKVGGVGFFADAGESARLYWMRITKNQDWLGRVCAYLSGGGGTTSTADLWRDRPAEPQPQPPTPAPSSTMLAALENGESEWTLPNRRILRHGRSEACKS